MSDIPCDVYREIFLRLPAQSVFRFRTVCKAWRRLIDDPSFVKAHTNNQLSYNTLLVRNKTGAPLYSFDLDSLNFGDGLQTIPVSLLEVTRGGAPPLPPLPVAACNGLILIAHGYRKKTWEIWNPLTQERLKLPQQNIDSRASVGGLGYDYATDDYKVVTIDKLWHRRRKFVRQTYIYSLKSDSWRMIGDCPWALEKSPGVFLNGALHWISRDWDMIIALDLGAENYQRLSLPPGPKASRMHLDAVGGCLILSYYSRRMKCFDGWVMKHYGSEDSWMKLFSLEEHDITYDAWSLRPVAYLKNKKQVFLQNDDEGLFWLDVGSRSVKNVRIHGLSGTSSSQICPRSLFRLHDNCGVSGSVATKKRKRKSKCKCKRKRKMMLANTRLTFHVRDAKVSSSSDDSGSSSYSSPYDSYDSGYSSYSSPYNSGYSSYSSLSNSYDSGYSSY